VIFVIFVIFVPSWRSFLLALAGFGSTARLQRLLLEQYQ